MIFFSLTPITNLPRYYAVGNVCGASKMLCLHTEYKNSLVHLSMFCSQFLVSTVFTTFPHFPFVTNPIWWELSTCYDFQSRFQNDLWTFIYRKFPQIDRKRAPFVLKHVQIPHLPQYFSSVLTSRFLIRAISYLIDTGNSSVHTHFWVGLREPNSKISVSIITNKVTHFQPQ